MAAGNSLTTPLNITDAGERIVNERPEVAVDLYTGNGWLTG
jgi:hypothetical protein